MESVLGAFAPMSFLVFTYLLTTFLEHRLIPTGYGGHKKERNNSYIRQHYHVFEHESFWNSKNLPI